jgi:membrane fusion protein (multidrug efflux system)
MFFCIITGSAAAQTSGPLPSVGFITASAQPVYNESSYVGRIQSPDIVALNARVTGYLEQQTFKDGDAVKQGELLYVIEQPPYQAAVDQAQATLEQAQAEAHNANLSLERASALLHTPAGQQSSVDAAKATALSDTAQIDSAEAQLKTAQINLSYTEIRSPIDGQIGATLVNVGNVVGPNSGTLDTIVAEDPMYVNFSIPVVDALQFRANSGAEGGLAGLSMLVQLPDGRMYNQTGSVDFVNNQVTTDTDTLSLRGTIANPLLPTINTVPGANRELTDGEFVTVILRARAPQLQVVVPRDAVITDQLGDYVLELDKNNTVIRTAVTLGTETNNSVQIVTGVVAGDRIIVEGIQRIHPGMTVNPKPAQNS